MKICLDIEFENKVVCIVGGGQVAYRKCQQFLKAKAIIYIYSLAYLDEFKDLNINFVNYDTLINKLDEAFLLIAATSSEALNSEVIAIAKKKKVLTMSSMSKIGEDTHSVIEKRYNNLLLASNTNGTFPLFSKDLLNDISKRLELLSNLRLSLIDKSLSSKIISLNNNELTFINSILNNKGLIYIMHGSKDELAHIEANILANQTSSKYKIPVSYLFIGKSFRHIDPKDYLDIIKSLNIEVSFILLFNDRESSYVKDMIKLIDNYPYQFIKPNYQLITNNQYITHTNNHNDGDVITIAYSSYMQAKYPNYHYISALSNISIINDIIERITII